MTDQRIVNTSVEAETAVRLEAALRHRADADGSALRLNLHRWRVALRSAGQTPSEALLELERVLERWTAVSGSFESQQSAIGSPKAVVADHRSRRAARAAGRTVQLEPPSQPELHPAAGVAMPRVASEALSQSSGSSAVLPTNSAQMSTVQMSTVQASSVQVDTVRIPVTKLDALLELVEELREEQHRALVFSQFTTHLDLVRKALDERGITYQYLDGSTPPKKRQQAVDAFQNGESDLFLISLKAGGTGLNLTAADYVIHLDPWWNPAVEDQATDRAHRIGQTRPVTVYRLIAKDTIEEKILALHERKRELVAGILEGSDQAAKLSTDDLVDLIRSGAAPEKATRKVTRSVSEGARSS